MESIWVGSEMSLKTFPEFRILRAKQSLIYKSQKLKLMQLERLMNLSTLGQLGLRIQMKSILTSLNLLIRLTKPAVTL